MGVSSGTTDVSLLLQELPIVLGGGALMSRLLFPSIPAIPPGSSSMMISQPSERILKVKVIVEHVNKTCSLKWNFNNSNAQNKGCKEGWQYHSGRLDCPSNSNGIKTFLHSAP